MGEVGGPPEKALARPGGSDYGDEVNQAAHPSPDALREAFSLAGELLTDLELSRLPLTNAALKASRLARLLNDFDGVKIFHFEASGYPSVSSAMTTEDWRLAGLAGRHYKVQDATTKEVKTYAFLESVAQLDQELDLSRLRIDAARDPDVSVSSSNPSQYVAPPMSNLLERNAAHDKAIAAGKRLSERRAFVYAYAANRRYELQLSDLAQDIFGSVRSRVDLHLGDILPDAPERITAIHGNIESSNPEDWANAVHGCRRLLQAVADAIYPPQATPLTLPSGKVIKVGAQAYVNRLVQYVQDRAGSSTYRKVVGTHIQFVIDRLDAVFQATNKGTHASMGQDEARRYVLYVYMIVADILSLPRVAPDPPAPL